MTQLRSIWQNPWTAAGVVIAILAVLFFISFQFLELVEPTNNPYTGLWSFLILPAFLVIGLLLIPVGYLIERRRRRRLFPDVHDYPSYPSLDLNRPGHRKAAIVFAVGSLVVIPLIGISSYEGYHYTDSTEFCGQVCHEVMHPEYTAYLNSPHARVTCASCHIGPGASWFVKSKVSGTRQVFAVLLKTYEKPIPTPVVDLRPARETCEQCHWPEKFFGSQLRTRVHFSSDEKNTRREIRVLVKTGGADSSMGPASGIHWHMALSHKIEYIATDRQRQVIPWVRSTDAAGRVSVYRSDNKTSEDPPPAGEIRRIDCVDCHNRPTHIVQPPDRAVSNSLETNRLDRTIPYVKKVAVEALTLPYGNEQEAESGIATYIRDFYRKYNPQWADAHKSSINQTIDEVRNLYRRNFFPRMKVDWRTYPDNIGHMIFQGCDRCHDGKHISNDKGPIRRDCTVCHEFQQPLESPTAENVFQQITPEHPYKLEGIHAELKCSQCHTGGRGPEPSCEGCHAAEAAMRAGKSPLQGIQDVPPTLMASLDCQSCHDLSKPLSSSVPAQCETCHDKGYGDMVQLWKDEVRDGRAKASAAVEELKKTGNGKAMAALEQMQAAMAQMDRGGPHHNTELADAVYKQVIKLAEEGKKF
jgi:hypothetical protein